MSPCHGLPVRLEALVRYMRQQRLSTVLAVIVQSRQVSGKGGLTLMGLAPPPRRAEGLGLRKSPTLAAPMRAWYVEAANTTYKAAGWHLLLSKAHSYGSSAGGMDVAPPPNEVPPYLESIGK